MKMKYYLIRDPKDDGGYHLIRTDVRRELDIPDGTVSF